jgi:hypothetical protein
MMMNKFVSIGLYLWITDKLLKFDIYLDMQFRNTQPRVSYTFGSPVDVVTANFKQGSTRNI